MEIETYFCKHKFQIQTLLIAEVYDKNLLIKSHMIIIYPSYEGVMSRVLCISKLVNAATYQDRARTTQGCRPKNNYMEKTAQFSNLHFQSGWKKRPGRHQDFKL